MRGRRYLKLLGCILACAFAPAAWATPVDTALVLAVDVSGSIDPEEAQLQRQGYIAALTDERVVRAIQSGPHGRIAIAYFEWSSAAHKRLLVDWTVIDGMASAQALAEQLASSPIVIGQRTSISGAIDYGVDLLNRVPFEAQRRVIDISGDGPNNDGGLILPVRDAAVAAGIVINGLPIVNDRPNRWGFPSSPDLDRYYEGCVIGGPGSFIVIAETFETFPVAVLQKLILEIAGFPRANGFAERSPRPGVQTIAAYEPGCDIGERRSRDFYRDRLGN